MLPHVGQVTPFGQRRATKYSRQLPGSANYLTASVNVRGVPRDAIPAIDRPTFDPAAKAQRLDSNELMIGIVAKGEQRAYSTWQLDRHEIVNDLSEGRPIAVSW